MEARPCHLLVRSSNASALACANRKAACSRLHFPCWLFLLQQLPVAPKSRMLGTVPQPCKASRVSVGFGVARTVLLGRVQTIQIHVTFGKEKSSASINTAMGKMWLIVVSKKSAYQLSISHRKIFMKSKIIHHLPNLVSNVQFRENACSDLVAGKEA